jgi:hypothetical protein
MTVYEAIRALEAARGHVGGDAPLLLETGRHVVSFRACYANGPLAPAVYACDFPQPEDGPPGEPLQVWKTP